MTEFDMFQEATCDLQEGNHDDARIWLDRAIAQIDADGVDAELRPELVGLRSSICNKP